MIVYVQSRGKKQDEDYRWLKIKENEHSLKTPKFLLQNLENSSVRPVDLIESQKFSIILVRSNRYFCLLITGLKAKENRNDFQNRRVRNSLFWICDTTEIQNAEMKIRSLLIRALHGDLEPEIDSAIDSDGKYGFRVKQSNLEQILLDSPPLLKNDPSKISSCKISSNSKSFRQKLASELHTHSLPERNGILVLVTTIKSASALQEIDVWRGLSSRIKDDEFKEYSSLEAVDRQAQKKTVFLSIAIAIILLIAISILTIWQKPQPKITPNSSPSQKTSSLQNSESLEQSINCIQAQKNNYFLSPCSWNISKN